MYVKARSSRKRLVLDAEAVDFRYSYFDSLSTDPDEASILVYLSLVSQCINEAHHSPSPHSE
jgi:hypothetical protein